MTHSQAAVLRLSKVRRRHRSFAAAATACAVALLWAAPVLAAGPNVVVTTANSGAGSLRDAIQYANAHPGTTISFQIPAVQAVGGVFTIKPTSPLTQIFANGTIVDGTTQTAFTGNTNAAGPEVVLNGSMSAASAGLNFTGANCQVKGLVVNTWTGDGITISGTGGKVTGCYIGTNAAGTAAAANTAAGVSLFSTGATVGGTASAARNLISGNSWGVRIAGTSVSNNLVQGNYIGTNAAGTAAVANSQDGVVLNGGPHGNTIGGTVVGAGNLISGNAKCGVELLLAGTTANLVQGNLIGTDKNGTAALGNAADGVRLLNTADGNTIGGTAAAAKNVISGNLQNGVWVGTASNLVQGNYIGTNAAGNAALGNGGHGVLINAGHDNTVGGQAAGARNLVSGNQATGVAVLGGGANQRVLGNYIGVNAGGTAALANHQYGVILEAVQGALVGGTAVAARNVISGNTLFGVQIRDTSTKNNLVQGNYIGTNANGGAAIPNGGGGIVLNVDAQSNTIGGSAVGAGNVISGNHGDGIEISGSANDSSILGNRIGTNFAGTGAVPNTQRGVWIAAGCSGHLVGGGGAGSNQISGNGTDGVHVSGTGNGVYGNKIGLNAAGTGALANGGSGVRVDGASNLVGGASLGNVISGNAAYGIIFATNASVSNVAAGNLIGLNPAGTAAVPNGLDGVLLTAAAHQNTVGGETAALRNVISGNTANGVHFSLSGTINNGISGNYIGTNAAGSAAVPNHASGVFFGSGASGSGANTVGVFFSGAGNVISGNLLDGVRISPPAGGNVFIEENLIGLNAAGTAAIPNGKSGVAVRATATAVNSTTINANVISGNTEAGIYIHGKADSSSIQGNFIGLDRTGTAAIANHGPGIWLTDSVSKCHIGGGNEGERNVISGNTQEGVRAEGGCAALKIDGNYVGTDATGLVDRGNGTDGISLADGTTNPVIGGTSAETANVISGNGGSGLRISGPNSYQGLVLGNFIGVNKNADAALANAQDGVLLEQGAHDHLVGGAASSLRNIISGNLGNGVRLKDAGTANNKLIFNFIGTNFGADGGIPNAKAGVEAGAGAGPAIIGGIDPAQANRIAYNTQDGVLVRDAATHGITIRGNQIHRNGGLGINLETTGAVNLVTPNDFGDGDSGPNGLQNFPLVRTATSTASSTSITIQITGFHPGQSVIVDIYRGDDALADPSGNGEGPRFFGTKSVTTSATGAGLFTFTVNESHPGEAFTATATDAKTGSTSEFSKWRKTAP